jgi:Zn-dependent M28 family amino/carboxypeptidase
MLASVHASAQSAPPSASFSVAPETRDAVRQLIGHSTLDGKAYAYDGELADTIGPRLTGSSNYMRAAEGAVQRFKEMGLANVHSEDWTIPATWEPAGPATGHIEKPVVHELHIYSVGWSPSTPPKGVEGEVVYVKSIVPEELDRQKTEIAGKIAFADGASFGAKATVGPVLDALAKLHSFAPAALVLNGGANGTLAESALSFDGLISSVPEAQIGREDELLIKRLLEKGSVTMQFSFSNTIRSKVPIPTVVAEIPGRDLPGEVVIVGAHLDSWQPGTGAQDNGTGVATVLEVARAIKTLNRPPRRTLRFLLFGGEEEGLLGSTAYARQHSAEMPKIDAVLVTDTGSAPAKGWYVMGREDEKGALTALKPLLSGLGADGVSTDATFIFATDHAAFDVLGVPSLVLWNDMQKYDQIKHRAADTFDSVVEADLIQDAVVTAVTAYAIADGKDSFAPHLSPGDVQSMLKKADSLGDYDYLKSTGALP